MHLKYGLWSLALYLFFAVVGGHVHREHNDGAMKEQGPQLDYYLPSMSSTNILRQTNNFFAPDELKVGKVMPLFFGGTFNPSPPPFLPKKNSDSIPFSSQQLPSIIRLFGFPTGSPQAKAMEYSLAMCEKEKRKGDIVSCVTSLESMVEFANQAFGSNAKVVRPSQVPEFGKLFQNFTILTEPKEVATTNVVMPCHVLPYPYAAYYCHYQSTHTKLLEVSVVGEDGSKMDATLVICHMDSSHMGPNTIAFTHFGLKHGDPVCHFVPPEDLVWISAHDPSIN